MRWRNALKGKISHAIFFIDLHLKNYLMDLFVFERDIHGSEYARVYRCVFWQNIVIRHYYAALNERCLMNSSSTLWYSLLPPEQSIMYKKRHFRYREPPKNWWEKKRENNSVKSWLLIHSSTLKHSKIIFAFKET